MEKKSATEMSVPFTSAGFSVKGETAPKIHTRILLDMHGRRKTRRSAAGTVRTSPASIPPKRFSRFALFARAHD